MCGTSTARTEFVRGTTEVPTLDPTLNPTVDMATTDDPTDIPPVPTDAGCYYFLVDGCPNEPSFDRWVMSNIRWFRDASWGSATDEAKCISRKATYDTMCGTSTARTEFVRDAPPSAGPTYYPTYNPTGNPSLHPTSNPSLFPTSDPTLFPTVDPTSHPTCQPSFNPTHAPTSDPTLPQCANIIDWDAGFGGCNTYAIGTRNNREGCNDNEIGTDGVSALGVCPECEKCYVNCEGSWSDYGECSATCGGGTQTRVFTIVTPAQVGGAECERPDGSTEERDCNTQSCPVDCRGSWGQFGACSVTCGGGTQMRVYTIDTPADFGGAECDQVHGSVETRFCNIDSCLRPQTQNLVSCLDRSCDKGFLECIADCADETYTI